MSKPNLILIYCDELRTDSLGCYGNPQTEMHTPQIDALAERGVRFSNNYCTAPVCVASRTSQLTGLYPEDTGVYHNEAYWPPYQMPAPPRTFPEVFAEHGYATANFGKVHVPHALQAWDYSQGEGGGMGFEYNFVYENLDRYGAVIDQHRPWLILSGRWPEDRPYFSANLVSDAVEWIREAEDPYLLRLSFLQPHTPVLVPPPFDTVYDPDDFRDFIPEQPEVSRYQQLIGEMCDGEQFTPEEIQLIQAHYYGLVAWIDAQVGALVDYLEQTGQLENTILVFEADHGVSLGEGGRFHKLTFSPEVHRVPRLISWPAVLEGGLVSDQLTQSLDLPRTLMGLAGIEAPEQFKGRDVFQEEEPEEVFATLGFGLEDSYAAPFARKGRLDEDKGWPRRSCIRTREFRLDKNVRIDGRPAAPDEEDLFLAHTREDPEEIHNLAGDPDFVKIEEELSYRLDEHARDAREVPPSWVGRNPELDRQIEQLVARIREQRGG
jgi:choline-sulfatase